MPGLRETQRDLGEKQHSLNASLPCAPIDSRLQSAASVLANSRSLEVTTCNAGAHPLGQCKNLLGALVIFVLKTFLNVFLTKTKQTGPGESNLHPGSHIAWLQQLLYDHSKCFALRTLASQTHVRHHKPFQKGLSNSSCAHTMHDFDDRSSQPCAKDISSFHPCFHFPLRLVIGFSQENLSWS